MAPYSKLRTLCTSCHVPGWPFLTKAIFIQHKLFFFSSKSQEIKTKSMIFIEPQLRYFADLVIFDMLSITCGSPHREEKSVLQTMIKNLAINCGFIMGALLMFFWHHGLQEDLGTSQIPTATCFSYVLSGSFRLLFCHFCGFCNHTMCRFHQIYLYFSQGCTL